MKLTIDTDKAELTHEIGGNARTIGLFSKEAFEAISAAWLKVGWSQKYSYAFTWLGRPLIQLPEDVLRIQEVIYAVQPDLIIETGVAHGGSLIFYASLCKTLGRGRVVGIDIEIREHNRKAIESHALAHYITLVEGSSVDPAVVGHVRELAAGAKNVLVILDSCHTKDHVLAELEAYHEFVTPGSYIVATDGIMRDLVATPGADNDFAWNNPAAAAAAFAAMHPEFAHKAPERVFNESVLSQDVTYWPDAWLKRIQ